MYLSDVLFFCFFFDLRVLIRLKMNKDCYYSKIVDFLLKPAIQGLLVETLEVLGVPRMWQGFSLLRLKLVVARSDYSQYHVGSFLVRS